jgi:hypothetical protein
VANSPFKPRKARKIELSDNPRSVANRERDHAKRGWDAAEQRVDVWFRTTKSRRLAKLHKLKGLSPQDRQSREDNVVDELNAEKRRKLKELEREWTRKVDEEDMDEDEDDAPKDLDEEYWIGEDSDEDEEEDDGGLTMSLDSVMVRRKPSWEKLMERLTLEGREE